MKKLIALALIVLITGWTGIAVAQCHGQKTHENLEFFGQAVGAYNETLKPEYAFEGALDYIYNNRLGGFAFFVVEESTSTAIGGGTVNLFPWFQVGIGVGYDQEPKDIVGAGMIKLSRCYWEIRGYGWVGPDDFYDYWFEGLVDTEHYVRFGATWKRWDGAGPWIGIEIPDTPVELRIGGKWKSALYDDFEVEGADPTYEATLRFNLP